MFLFLVEKKETSKIKTEKFIHIDKLATVK